jgi:hypothetical protein
MPFLQSKKISLIISFLFCVCVFDPSLVAIETQMETFEDAKVQYQKVRAEIESKYVLKHGSDLSGLTILLNRVWLITSEVAIVYLKDNPNPTPKGLVKEIESLDLPRECGEYDHKCFEEYHLDADVLCLQTGENAAYLVAVGYPRFGTFYIVRRNQSGLFQLVWNIKDIAAKHYPLRDELGYWAYIGFPYNDGPLKVLNMKLIPKLQNGNPRFLIDAWAARYAGGTGPSQLSIWEWNGVVANPLIIKSYLTSFTTPGSMKVDGENIKVPTKEDFKTFFSCGMCEEPVGEWTIRVTKDGVKDLGHKHVVPQLQIIDELFDRILHGQTTEDIASARVSGTLKKEIQELSEYEKKNMLIGMLGSWKVQPISNGSEVCLATDGIQAFIYTIITRHQKQFISNISKADNYCAENL